MTRPGPRTVSRTVEVAAAAETVFALVSDLPGMGAFSPENDGGRWTGGATGPAVGAVFVGTNRQGRRRWSTRSTVVEHDPPRSFAFEVSSAGLPVARWAYEVVPTATGCTVTETWTDRRGRLVTVAGRLLTGVAERDEWTATSIEQTLAAVRRAAEG